MTPYPAEYAPRVVATYQVRHAATSAALVAQELLALLCAGVRLIDLSDHDRRADVVSLRTNGDVDDGH
jgi:hypothetical protein